MNQLKKKFQEDLHLFYQATYIPFCVFDNEQNALLRYPVIASMDSSTHTLQTCCTILDSRSNQSHLPVFLASALCFLALIRLDSNTNIMFGPISATPLTYSDFFNANKDYSSPENLMHLYRIIQQSPHIQPVQFANIISLYIQLAFQEKFSAQEILANYIYMPENSTLAKTEDVEEPTYVMGTDAIQFENQILYHIQYGQVAKLKEYTTDIPVFSVRNVFPSTIEELQQDFLFYASLCLKAAIDKGVDLEKALTILDMYFSQIPSMNTPKQFAVICNQLAIDYCQQVANLHQSHTESYVVTKCVQYIEKNIHSRITLENLSQHCHFSKRTITRHFSEYCHMPVAEYILQLKLKEAAFLLTNTSFSLVEISNQLAFSSQSHFSVAFKKKYNHTPQQYRDKYKTD